MAGLIKLGDRVAHYRYGKGVVERLVSQGLAEVRFGDTVQYVQQKNLQSLDQQERQEHAIRERARQEVARQENLERESKRRQIKSKVLAHLGNCDYESARDLYQADCIEWWPPHEYEVAVVRAREDEARKDAEESARKLGVAREVIKAQVLILLEDGKYSDADHLYSAQCADWWKHPDYDIETKKARFMRLFVHTYGSGSMADLDAVFRDRPDCVDFSTEDYTELKLPKLRGYLDAIGMQLDPEQERAIARPENRLLIRARAGSGKTRTLCARAAIAIHYESLNPDQVMILSFNKAAAAEVRHRVQTIGGISDFGNARTFHSLAYQLVQRRKKLLFDAGGHPSEREQSRFVQRMMQRIMNPAFKEALLEFFRRELEQIEDIGRDLQPKEYFEFRRALEHVTLQGERVKSNGEKFIADFLFEYGIEYRYERAWAWKTKFLNGATYKPDFAIIANGKDYILEHWAIDPNDRSATVPEYWDTSTELYRRQILAKREFWQSKGITLLETHTGLMRNGREAFEDRLGRILQRAGIQCNRLAKEEIIRRVFDNDFVISRVAELFLQFIQRAKKRGWSADEVGRGIVETPDKEPRARLFHQLALRAYREYETVLKEQQAMDFDDLLAQATFELEERGESVSIHLGQGRMVSIASLRWILLDEYQDFSDLYFKMLNAILKANPNISLVAVGDDWQAINAFAGAELRFFERFVDFFPGAESVGVTTNYRSDRTVVAAGNRLMVGRGSPAKVSRSAPGLIEIKYLGDVWIEFRPGLQFQTQRESDALYLPPRPGGRKPSEGALRQAQALKLCAQIIFDEPDGKTMVLARTGRAYGLELTEFRDRLVAAVAALQKAEPESIAKSITAMTAHGSKGQEKNRIIILDATQRQFPKVHPDNLLFGLFGVTVHAVLEEERRLFYVAMTRAEHRLYILTDKGDESPYLEVFDSLSIENENQDQLTAAKLPQLGAFAGKIQLQLRTFCRPLAADPAVQK